MIVDSFSLHAFLTCDLRARLQTVLPFLVYPIFSAIDLLGIYQGLKHVHLQTLTKVTEHFLLQHPALKFSYDNNSDVYASYPSED